MFNHLPEDKILEWTKLKVFAETKIYSCIPKLIISLFDRVVKHSKKKGEKMLVKSLFSFFNHIFKRLIFIRHCYKTLGLCGKEGFKNIGR